MLDSRNNRINFGEALVPEVGYELDFAIGTSYNLDLESMMFLPVALFFGQDFKVEKSVSNELLSALTKVPEKVMLFCQKGKIKAPAYYSEILAFWEKSITQIHLDKYNKSFHPKVWLIRYKNQDPKKPIKYKFISTSRNLTQTRDWDIAFTFDGEVRKKAKVISNKPLLDFVNYLSKQSERIPKDFIEDINYIQFDFGEFDEILFHPIGIGKSVPLLHADFNSDELLIMSPFLHEKTVAEHLKRSKKLSILSRENELDKIHPDSLKKFTNIYQFNPIIEDGFVDVIATDSSDETADIKHDDSISDYETGQQMHAKLYVSQFQNQIKWFIGSANCTNPASERNIEFLVEIRSENKKLYSPKQLINQLLKRETENSGSLFEQYEIKKEVEKDAEQERFEQDLRRIIYEISSAIISGKVTKNEVDFFDMSFDFSSVKITNPDNWKISFKPISAGIDNNQIFEYDQNTSSYTFKGFEQHRLSPFLCFYIEYQKNLAPKEFVIEVDMELGENRNKAIFKHILGNQEKLFKFLLFLLAKEQIEPILYLGEEENLQFQKVLNSKIKKHTQYPMYEKLLYASSRDKNGLTAVIDIVESLHEEKDEHSQDLISKEFYDLISIFKSLETE